MKKWEHFPSIFDCHDGKFHKFVLAQGKQEQRKLIEECECGILVEWYYEVLSGKLVFEVQFRKL